MITPETKYPKHFIVIRDQSFNIGDNITIEEDLDNVFTTASFDLPYFETEQWTTKELRKYDVVKIYYNEFNTPLEQQSATVDDCYLIFDGYIDGTPLNENKTDGINWSGLKLKSTLGLTYERTMTTPLFTSDINTLMARALEETSLIDYIPYFEIDNNISENLVLKVQSDKFLGKIFDQIKEKYAIQVFQKSDGGLRFQFPSSFNTLGQNLRRYYSNGVFEMITDQEEAWVYDLTSNCFSVDYGDLTQRVDTVIVYGLNVLGLAFDPIAYQLKDGVRLEDIENNITPVKSKMNPLQIFRRDVFDEETCQTIARETLIDYAKNYGISLEVMYNPKEKIGDRFIITNSEVVSPQQIWIIKKRTITLSKTSAVGCSIVAYSSSVGDFPSDILLGSSGILDTDVLNLTDRISATTNLLR